MAYLIVRELYEQQQLDPALDKRGKKVSTGKFDPLIFYCFFGILIGARLGHCIFYEPSYFLGSAKGVVEMFLPIRFAADSWNWHYTGYTGLASHGGTLGLALALWLYVRHTKVPMLTVLDNIAIAAPFTAFCIRMGNLMNSEIIGSRTDVPWAFIFHTREALVDGQLVPRHPSQLYEALAYLLIFIIGYCIYRSNRHEGTRIKVGKGFYFGYCITTIFVFRFFIEFLKIVQGGTDDGSTLLNMGQMLSIPFILVGCWFLVKGLKKDA